MLAVQNELKFLTRAAKIPPSLCLLRMYVLSTELFLWRIQRKCTFSAYQLMHKDVFCQARLAHLKTWGLLRSKCLAFQKNSCKGGVPPSIRVYVVILDCHVSCLYDTVKHKLFFVLRMLSATNTVYAQIKHQRSIKIQLFWAPYYGHF